MHQNGTLTGAESSPAVDSRITLVSTTLFSLWDMERLNGRGNSGLSEIAGVTGKNFSVQL